MILIAKKHLFVKRSGIPKAGKGLFTKTDIAKGCRIVEYEGRITTWKEALQSVAFNGYIFYINRNHVIDAMPYTKALGRYVNDANGIYKMRSLINNAKYVVEDARVFIQATKNIKAGDEILVSYKKEYWDVIKHNNLCAPKTKKKK